MTVFWIMALLASALAGWTVLTAARGGATTATTAQPDLGAAELDELDRLKARGLLADDAHAAARAEAGRRLLSTPEPASVLTVAAVTDQRAVLIALVAAVLAALGLYMAFGSAGFPDQAYETRIEQWATGAEPLEPEQVAAVIGREARLRPDDMQVQAMLGSARFQAGDPIGAASAFRRILAKNPNDARSWARLGESLVRSQDGVVGADAEAAFRQAVKLDPDQLGARFFLGEAALARNDLDGARAAWTPLIGALDPADPRRADLVARLARAERSEAERSGSERAGGGR
jgi:cytochrome c-type biogenesis protein CcmH